MPAQFVRSTHASNTSIRAAYSINERQLLESLKNPMNDRLWAKLPGSTGPIGPSCGRSRGNFRSPTSALRSSRRGSCRTHSTMPDGRPDSRKGWSRGNRRACRIGSAEPEGGNLPNNALQITLRTRDVLRAVFRRTCGRAWKRR